MRRKLLKTGAAAAAMAATPSALAQQSGNGESGCFYQRGNVRIRYEETGLRLPAVAHPGGGLNGSTIAGIHGGNPLNDRGITMQTTEDAIHWDMLRIVDQ